VAECQPGAVGSRRRPGRTHEQVVGVRDVAADAEELHEVVELAVDVAAYLGVHVISSRGRERGEGAVGGSSAYRHGRVDANHVALFDQQLARLVAQLAHLVLGDWPARAELLDRPARRVSARRTACQRTTH